MFDYLPSTEELKETVAQREEKIRESWVKAMEVRIVREELQKCHKAEGINHYQVCHNLAKKYSEMLKDAKVQLEWLEGHIYRFQKQGGKRSSIPFMNEGLLFEIQKVRSSK